MLARGGRLCHGYADDPGEGLDEDALQNASSPVSARPIESVWI